MKDFSPDENLYRAVKPKPIFWKMAVNRPSSALFKDSNGVSVDRQADRTVDEALETVRENFSEIQLKAIVGIMVKECEGIGAIVKYKPIESNTFHSEIHNSLEEAQLTDGKAKRLARLSKIYYQS